MGTYGGRRGPNVSQYLRELNTIPAHDKPAADEAFGMEDDLAMFTNTQFFDFDSGQNTDYNAPPPKPESTETQRPEGLTSPGSVMGDFGIEFMPGEFNLADFGSAYASPTIPTFSETLGNHLQPIQPNPQAVYPPPPLAQHQAAAGYHPPQAPRIADKRKSDASLTSPSSRSLSFEEASRLAAEEDKRRRNTAASARFRIKKKQREQALEKSAKEMSEKVTALEGRIQQLETENKWLKNLIMEKNEGNEDLVKLWKEFGSKDSDKKDAGANKSKENVADSVTVAGSESKSKA
ncbi:hypothetical protein VTK73DRAFT_8610 [Phialemonium thermophilum]|uniref:BZIP domain-containing protein n=1 Tax=Phialemonium thermophilum TaxID=223376 RepID=A0ABR3XPN3_9PEZI